MKWSSQPWPRLWQERLLKDSRDWKRLPLMEKRDRAMAGWLRLTLRLKLTHKWRPVVQVIRAQGKPLLVLRVGDRFVSSFTWDRLMFKAAYGHWKNIHDTTLADRLPEDA